MSTPGFKTSGRYPDPPPPRGGIGKILLGAAAALGLLALLSQCQDEPPEDVRVAPPEPRILEPWEVETNAIVIVFNDSGRFYGAAGQTYLQADREATERCWLNKHQNAVCYGVNAYEAEAPGKMCVGIGVDFLKPVPRSQRLDTTIKATEYILERDETTQGALDKVWTACTTQPLKCDHGVFVQCNFPASSPNGKRFNR